MELWHLQTFLTVIEAESLTAAAERLPLSQPSISAHIRALEEDLGVSLFHRTGRGMKLTSVGEELRVLAQDIVTRARAMEARAAQLRGEGAGTLRLGAIYSGADLAIATSLGRLRQRHPELRIELTVQSSGNNARGLLEQELDVAFVEGNFDDSRLCLQRVATSRVGIIGPYDWRDRLPAGDWSRLAEKPWLFQSNTCSYFRLLTELGNSHAVTFEPAYRTDMFGTIGELVAEGQALSLVDLDSVRPFVETQKVFVWGDFEYSMPVSLACLHARRSEPAIARYWENCGSRPVQTASVTSLSGRKEKARIR